MHRSLMGMQDMPVTSEQGLRLGVVTDAYFDPVEQRLIAFLVDWENDLVRGPEDILPLMQIAELNADVLTVSHEMATTAGLEYDAQIETEGLLLAIENLIGKPVAYASGERIGTLADLQFDPQDGSVEAFEIGDADMAGDGRPNLMLPPDPEMEIQDGRITVPDDLKKTLDRHEQQLNNPRMGVTFMDGQTEEELVGEDDVEVSREPNIKPY